MRLAKPFTMPEVDPVIPDRLSERITTFLPNATKIDIEVAIGTGWRKANAIYLDGDEEAAEVYTMVKACADHYVEETGEDGKFRAMIWRMPTTGTQVERRFVTFSAGLGDGEPSSEETQELTTSRVLMEGWRELADAYRVHAEFSERSRERAVDRVLEQSRLDAERLDPMSDIIRELVTPYREGLQMQAKAVREVGELRVRQQIAEVDAEQRGKLWEVLGPAVKLASAQAQRRLLGGATRPARALPATRRTEAVAGERAEPVAHEAPGGSAPPGGPPGATAQGPEEDEPEASLCALARGLLDSLPTALVLELHGGLQPEQSAHLRALASAADDDEAAEAIVALMRSLQANPVGVLEMQRLLEPAQLVAFQQLAVLASRHLDGARAERPAGGETSGDDAA